MYFIIEECIARNNGNKLEYITKKLKAITVTEFLLHRNYDLDWITKITAANLQIWYWQ